MGYLHIPNLYKDQRILLFRECYALEKVHGTSAHVSFKVEVREGCDGGLDHVCGPGCDGGKTGKVDFFSGGERHERFVSLFDQEKLTAGFLALGHAEVTVYGEAYGGKCQGMKATYGDELRFIAFDVQVGESWISVPDMQQVCDALGIETVPWRKVSTDIAALDCERDRASEVAVRRGIAEVRLREGVVLRPLVELVGNNGGRVIAKHKGDTFEERKTPQKIVDADKLEVLASANAIAEEWVTPMRLTHVLDKIPGANIEQTRDVIRAMVEDVLREAAGEIVESKEAVAAIGRRTAELFKARLKSALRGE